MNSLLEILRRDRVMKAVTKQSHMVDGCVKASPERKDVIQKTHMFGLETSLEVVKAVAWRKKEQQCYWCCDRHQHGLSPRALCHWSTRDQPSTKPVSVAWKVKGKRPCMKLLAGVRNQFY